MLRVRIILFSLSLSCSTFAQNLVPNPGFEHYNHCPEARGSILYIPEYKDFLTATGWVSPLENTTPDYYNTCATNPLVTLPKNTYNDYQQPHGGNACTGFSMFSGYPDKPYISDYREYIQARLLQPLEAGKQYELSFFVNIAFHLPEDYNQVAIDLVGAKFTRLPINVSYPTSQKELYLEEIPDIVCERNSFITDTASWVNIRGIYEAKGGEEWITIGYFKDSLPVNLVLLYSPVTIMDSIASTCYMYVDDVCLHELLPPVVHDTMYVTEFPTTISAAVTDKEYNWSTGMNTHSIAVEDPGTYWVITKGDCSYRVDTFTVVKCPVDTFISDTTIYTATFPFELQALHSGQTYLWQNGFKGQELAIFRPGIYYVQVLDRCNYYIDTVHVIAKRDEECIWLPTAFTPNGDGMNDYFGPVDDCLMKLPYYNFSIYNRWGQRVFYTDNFSRKWNGYFKGEQQELGTYFYILQYSKSFLSSKQSQELKVIKGDVMLLR